jgi:hypothetical protein
MAFQPILITKLELDKPLPIIMTENQNKGVHYGSAQLLIRLHQQPLGMLELPLQHNAITPDTYAPRIWDAFGPKINAHLSRDGLPQLTALPLTGIPGNPLSTCKIEEQKLLQNAPFISVVICTHERPAMLAGCLESVFKLKYPCYEVIVVDNAPKTGETCAVVENMMMQFSNLRYVIEPNQGQCWARNTGAKASRGEIIAFTDDDVIVDAYWLIGVLRGFATSENVGAVSGLTIPAELETEEQTWFEQSGGFNKGL